MVISENRIDRIISNEIRLYESQSMLNEGIMDFIRQKISNFINKKKKANGDAKDDKSVTDEKREKKEKRKKRKAKKKEKDKNRPKYRTRKKKLGGRESYNYDKYESENRRMSKADTDSLIEMIDMEKTNLAAIARIVFPDHTDEGAQSQLRKILNRERPLTKRVADILRRLIANGQIAIK